MKHDAFCNIVRFSCPSCGLYRSYCLSHQEPTSANRCSCQERHNKHTREASVERKCEMKLKWHHLKEMAADAAIEKDWTRAIGLQKLAIERLPEDKSDQLEDMRRCLQKYEYEVFLLGKSKEDSRKIVIVSKEEMRHEFVDRSISREPVQEESKYAGPDGIFEGYGDYDSDAQHRELSHAELSCPIRGCSLGANHNGPCIPRHADEETSEIREANLILLSRDDPEGFRMKIRELLSERNQSK